MGAAFIITLREGMEIYIVLAILVSYLVKTDRRRDITAVWWGAGVAAVLCLIAGVAVHAATDGLEGKAEQAVEGSLALAAALMLTFMILWMHRNARSMGGHLRARLDAAATAKAVAVIAFIGVAREGFETALFLLGADAGSASGGAVVAGGLLGLAVSAVAGWLIYAGGHRVDLAVFFRWTGVLLILFAAGLVGKAVHEFRELLGLEDGWLLSPMWTFTSGALASGTTHDFLKGLFGWSPNPERIRVFAYIAYAVPALWLFLRPHATQQPTPDVAPAEATAAS